jgi:hypothetical protein
VLMTIYALADPDSGEGRSIGQTTNHPWARDHDMDCRTSARSKRLERPER